MAVGIAPEAGPAARPRSRSAGGSGCVRYTRRMSAQVLHPRYLLPVAPENGPENAVLEGTSVAVEDGRIAAVAPRAEIDARFPDADAVTLDAHALLPGLVNAHGHLAMSLMRGVSEAQPLDAWLRDTIWPLEARCVDADFVRDGTALALAEMIASGTTCASDMYWFPEAAAEVASAAGFRLHLAFPVTEFESAWARSADECIHKGLALRDRHRDDDRVTVAFGPHAAYTTNEAILRRVQVLDDEIDAGIQIHLHESASEVAAARERTGGTWVQFLDAMGLLTPGLQAVHMTQLTDRELERVALGGVHVVHCPRSNLKLASGRCRVNDLQAAGVNVALGTDGAASNNSLDLFDEMRAAALLRTSLTGDATAAPLADMLEMATLAGARALGLDDEIGSVEVGKRADLVAVDFGAPGMQPVHDPLAQLVHGQAGRHVSHVWVGGRPLYESGRHLTLDMERVLARAGEWPARMAS